MNLHAGVVYGPIRSRRLGLSLGINILPPLRKVCSFNCIYCQYGWTEAGRPVRRRDEWPAPETVADATAHALGELAGRGVAVDRLTLAGHGEPTLHPDFPAVVEALRALRDRHAPGVALAVLSNSTTADRPDVAAALRRVDDRYMKLDAGDQDTLRHVNASAHPVSRIVAALAALPSVIVQTLLVGSPRPHGGNVSNASIDAWLAAVARIRPDAVHLYTVARATAWDAVRPCPVERLEAVAERVREVGVSAFVFP